MDVSELALPAVAETVLESSAQEFHRLSFSTDWVTVLSKGLAFNSKSSLLKRRGKLPLSPQIYI